MKRRQTRLRQHLPAEALPRRQAERLTIAQPIEVGLLLKSAPLRLTCSESSTRRRRTGFGGARRQETACPSSRVYLCCAVLPVFAIIPICRVASHGSFHRSHRM